MDFGPLGRRVPIFLLIVVIVAARYGPVIIGRGCGIVLGRQDDAVGSEIF
jgi:hypothetical protein